jgi:ribosomal protein L40E
LAVASVNIVASVLFFIAGFLIIAASAVGMVYFSRQLVPTPPMPPSQAQPAKAQQAAAAAQPVGEFCPKCGNRTSPDDVFCRKCGAKLT